MEEVEYKSFKLSGIIKKVLYKNDETKYIIAVLENNQKVCGTYFDTDIEKIVGEEVVLKGNWTTHKKYGVQFEFDTLELKEAEIFFFLTKIVKGVGKKFAHELLEKYSEELYSKPRYLVINKIDLLETNARDEVINDFITRFKQHETNTNFDQIFVISGATGEKCKELCYYLMSFIEQKSDRKIEAKAISSVAG